ncbi:glycosyltransferase family 61 protein [Falsirhodobacter algicola]|uniref:DUF563 domain-containing protein n=1 Tax=Falsirhodobacter algicola TaxID=2692330 RepID=A0A8J8MSS2_9RHOB|nr:glycosyltransferase family 61 protein [Falsirhodobacter algicola]QUS35812.1 DUF563 domain-containing protein [Falsirhodobacter algicola]
MNLPPVPEATPDDVFIPGVDPGMALLRREDLAVCLVPPVDVDGLVLSSQHDQRVRMEELLRSKRAQRWSEGVVFPAVLTVADDVGLHRSHVTVGGKFCPWGPGGYRFRAAARDTSLDAALVERLQEASHSCRLEVEKDDMRDLDLLIDARNFHEFDSYLTETLPLLELYARYDLRGRVIIATTSRTQQKGFVRNLIRTWFPELSGRVELRQGPRDFGRVLLPLDTRHLYHMCRGSVMPSLPKLGEAPFGRTAELSGVAVAKANSTLDTVMAFRERVLAQIRPKGRGRRLYIQRRSRRAQRVVNEDLLLERLRPLGFEPVTFEDMSIEDQARTVAGAEFLVGVHGAGISNMLFVPNGCKVIELSNMQTLLARWGMFNGMALASQAEYRHVFLDHDFALPDVMPSIAKDGHRGVEIDAFAAAATAAWIHAQIDPEARLAAHEECRRLNEDQRFDDLSAALDRHDDLLFHLADAHVWRANCASRQGDRRGALEMLQRAMVLAPARLPLMKRILILADALGEREVFDRASAQFLKLRPQAARLFLAEQGWMPTETPAEE